MSVMCEDIVAPDDHVRYLSAQLADHYQYALFDPAAPGRPYARHLSAEHHPPPPGIVRYPIPRLGRRS